MMAIGFIFLKLFKGSKANKIMPLKFVGLYLYLTYLISVSDILIKMSSCR